MSYLIRGGQRLFHGAIYPQIFLPVDIYFEGSGSVPITPAFSSYWTHTASAIRVPGRFQKYGNNGYVDLAHNTPLGTYASLYAQVIIPLTKAALFGRKLPAIFAGGGIYLNGPYALTRLPGSAATAFGASCACTARIATSSGTIRGSADHSLNVGFVANSRNLTSSSAFLSSDIGRQVFVSSFGGAVGTIIHVTNSSNANMEAPYSGSTGTEAVLLKDVIFPTFNDPTNRINGGGYGDTSFTSGGTLAVFSSVMADTDYLVVEMGLADSGSVNVISQEISLGDPSTTFLTGSFTKTSSHPSASSGCPASGPTVMTSYPPALHYSHQ
jgi:hypothetical protein